MVTQSVVKEIGILVPQFKEDKLIVLFGPAKAAGIKRYVRHS